MLLTVELTIETANLNDSHDCVEKIKDPLIDFCEKYLEVHNYVLNYRIEKRSAGRRNGSAAD